MRLLAAAPRALTPLALLAALLALVVPSRALAGHSDLLLALLVLATALGIPAGELRALRRHRTAVAVLSIAPLLVLAPLAWLIGRGFGPDVRDGLLAVGLSSSEVATVGLVALAGADATIALGAVTGSLIIAAVTGPLLIGVLAGTSAHAGGGAASLLGRFALVVIGPLIAGVAARTLRPGLAAVDAQRDGVAALAVVLLVYGALSGTQGAHGLGAALAAALIFLLVSGLLGELWRRRTAPGAAAIPGALAIGMRDFAVAAALAAQAFGPRAAAVPGVYGVVMLVAGAITASRIAATGAGGAAGASGGAGTAEEPAP
ncbi:MAG TPA: bile acid:sodium symporter [Solirubrobacteraceae bacterium]|nr:bile acid:sodium symporter [Solirubrobacteraceae bacterium]